MKMHQMSLMKFIHLVNIHQVTKILVAMRKKGNFSKSTNIIAESGSIRLRSQICRNYYIPTRMVRFQICEVIENVSYMSITGLKGQQILGPCNVA